jgi:2-keto-4-pentenoate hydratase/2-oxohepta-3-ene-1,7-dioic acid hydratase in catechol pathway
MSQANSKSSFVLGTFSVAGCAPFAGLVIDERVLAVEALRAPLAARGIILPARASVLDLLEEWELALGALRTATELVRSGQIQGVQAVESAMLKTNMPVSPRQVFCCGANYRQHVIDIVMDIDAPEMRGLSREEKRARAEKLMDERAANGKPYIFSKLPTSLTGPFDAIVLPPNVKQPDWELELAVIIGKPARHVSRQDAMRYVAGYAVANDLSSRDLLFREDIKAMGTDWVACKNAPSWAPIGPYLVPTEFVSDPHNLQMTLKLNGKVMQDAKTNDMIFDIPRQIEYLSGLVQLLPGDVICTGSPAGNGSHYNRYLQPGDVVECSIAEIGSLRNVCEAERCVQN